MLEKFIIKIINIYQISISAYIRGYCRHDPSCSEYTKNSIIKYGTFRGIIFGIKRLTRCRPFGSSGYDPIP